MWSDNETLVDLLEVDYLKRAVVHAIRSEHLLPVTVGVFGDWGSGKSSLIGMVREELETDPGILCVAFNGWKFESYEDARAALMGTILDEITERRTLSEKAAALAAKLLKRVDWFRLLGLAGRGALTFTTGLPLVGPGDVQALVSSLPSRLKDLDPEKARELLKEAPEGSENARRTIRDFQDDFAELLEKSTIRTLVVFIDDLDRCLPDTVIEILEAIRLFLFVPRTAFVIGADEDLVRHAVRMRFPEAKGTELDVGQNYLEKLIQIPIRVPPLGRTEMEGYMNLLFGELHLGRERVRGILDALPPRGPGSLDEVAFTYPAVREQIGEEHPELAEDLALAEQIADVLTAGLHGNPRQTKRFLNAMLLRVQMADARGIRLKRRVLAKLMLLEYLKPEAFRLLGEWQARHDGPVEILGALEGAVRGATTDDAVTVVPGEKGGASSSRGKRGTGTSGAAPIPVVPVEFRSWLEGPWLRQWLAIEPALGSEDLRPYFFFARERTAPWPTSVRTLTPVARGVLTDLLSGSKAGRREGVANARKLSPVEASSVFQALASQVRRSEDLAGRESPLFVLIEFGAGRPDLLDEVVALVDSLPAGALGPSTAPALLNATRGTPAAGAARRLLQKWAGSQENTSLERAARVTLEQFAAGPDTPSPGGR